MRLYVMDADGSDPRESDRRCRDLLHRLRRCGPTMGPASPRSAAATLAEATESNFVIIDVEDGTVIKTGPSLPQEGGSIEWAPDDSRLLMVPNIDGGRHLFLDPAGGPWTEAPWDSGSFPGWQRKAE